MTKKIVFINQSAGYTTVDIANNFTDEYDKVAVIYGSLIIQDIPLKPEIDVSKIFPKKRKSTLSRLFSWMIAAIQIHILLLTKYRGYEIFYFTLPPFAYFSSLFIKRKFSLMVFDVYPDVLKIINIHETHPVYKIWARINKKLFPKAHKIYTISHGMQRLLSQYVNDEKINIVPLWSGLTEAKPIKKTNNDFAIKHGLTNKFIVQYSGNIGQTHNLEVLIETARKLHHYNDIHFLIIGRGVKLNKIKSLAESYKLSNVQFLPFQPYDTVKYSLASADIGVVVIDEKSAEMSIPSKVYNIMSVGSAMLCIAPKKSELGRLVDHYQNGKAFNSKDEEGIANYILSLYENKTQLEELKNHSLEASKNHTIKNAEHIFNKYLETK